MSHLSEDSKGFTVDPKQKTLSSFIVTDDAMGRGLRDQKLSEFNLRDDTSSIGGETSFSDDTHMTCESMDLVDSQKIKISTTLTPGKARSWRNAGKVLIFRLIVRDTVYDN